MEMPPAPPQKKRCPPVEPFSNLPMAASSVSSPQTGESPVSTVVSSNAVKCLQQSEASTINMPPPPPPKKKRVPPKKTTWPPVIPFSNTFMAASSVSSPQTEESPVVSSNAEAAGHQLNVANDFSSTMALPPSQFPMTQIATGKMSSASKELLKWRTIEAQRRQQLVVARKKLADKQLLSVKLLQNNKLMQKQINAQREIE